MLEDVCEIPENKNSLTYSHTYPDSDKRFKYIYVDIIGLLPACEYLSYQLTCIDWFSRWYEALTMTYMTAYMIAKTFLANWVARFGFPEILTTDRGRQFESDPYYSLLSPSK